MRKIGPSSRSPTHRSIALAVRGANGMVTIFPPLRVMVRVRWPRSTPSCPMSAFNASEIRNPLSANRRPTHDPCHHKVRPGPRTCPARCDPTQWHGIHSRDAGDAHEPPGTPVSAVPRDSIGRTRPPSIAACRRLLLLCRLVRDCGQTARYGPVSHQRLRRSWLSHQRSHCRRSSEYAWRVVSP